MDNKKAVEILRKNWCYSVEECEESLDKAIASLEAWDKVKEDIKHSQYMFLSGDKGIECIPIFEVMNIINNHLGEVNGR